MSAAARKKYVITGYLNKEKSSEFFSLLGSWNKRYFTFDGIVLNYYQDADGVNFMGPSGSIHIRYACGQYYICARTTGIRCTHVAYDFT